MRIENGVHIKKAPIGLKKETYCDKIENSKGGADV